MSQTKIDIANLSDNVVAALSVPKISGISYPGDDTAAAPSGGQQITINGSGFAVGALVYVDNSVVGVSSVVSGTQIVFTSPAKVAGTYELKVLSTDGGSATFNNNIQYSGTPVWATAAGSLATVYESNAISNTFSATSDSAVTYTVTSGSLPAGGTLNSSTGALTGTASSVGSSTTYSFTVDAVDAEQQETPRNFSYTINPDVVTWSSPENGVTYTSTEGNVFTQALSATSAAGKTISYSANSLPTGLSISGANISGTFSAATSSASLITATAATTGKTATRTLNWSVTSLIPVRKLWSWGNNSSGALGLGDTVNKVSPVQVGADTNWSVQESGNWTTLAIKSNNTLWGWGDTSWVDSSSARSSPVQIGSLTNWASLTMTPYHASFIKTDGTLWAAGYNFNGQLGDGTNILKFSPKQIGAMTNWLQVSAEFQTVSAIKTDGTLWTWGEGFAGALGLGDTNNRSSPNQVGSLTNWKSTSSSNYITLAIKTNGTLWAWGTNGYGMLGQGDTIKRSSPVQVGALTNWSSVVASNWCIYGIKTDGTLWAWGRNYNGQLGLNNTVERYSPVQVGSLTTWAKVDGAAGQTAIAVKTDGTLWVWGGPASGASLGLGDTITRSSPVQVGSLTNWVDAAACATHTIATSY